MARGQHYLVVLNDDLQSQNTAVNLASSFFVPRFRESVGTLNLIRLSVCLSVCHKNFNLGHNFWTITDRALILGMCVPCDKTFPVVPCRDLDGDLWPSSRSNLLPSGGPQFSEFACFFFHFISYLFATWNDLCIIGTATWMAVLLYPHQLHCKLITRVLQSEASFCNLAFPHGLDLWPWRQYSFAVTKGWLLLDISWFVLFL